MTLYLLACLQEKDTQQQSYFDVIEETLELGQEWRVLIELKEAENPRVQYKVQEETDSVQFSLFDAEGQEIWIQDSSTPETLSYQPFVNCTDHCSFVSKVVYLDGESPITISLSLYADVYASSL